MKRIGGNERYPVHDYDLDLDNLEIYLFGREEYLNSDNDEEPGIEYGIANRFIRNLHMCVSNSKDKNKFKPILIHMKTNGGDWHEGMAIYDAIKSVPNKVTIVNYTHARSMSSIILQAAQRRVMMPHSVFMFHRGSYSMTGTMQEVESNWEFDRRDDSIMMDIYAKRMIEKEQFKTRSKARDWLKGKMMFKTDVFLTADEAVKYGLADEVFTSWRSLRK